MEIAVRQVKSANVRNVLILVTPVGIVVQVNEMIISTIYKYINNQLIKIIINNTLIFVGKL